MLQEKAVHIKFAECKIIGNSCRIEQSVSTVRGQRPQDAREDGRTGGNKKDMGRSRQCGRFPAGIFTF